VTNEDNNNNTPSSTFSGIVTYNGTPIQSAEVDLCMGNISVQKAYTDKDGKYEMVAVITGYSEGGSGPFFDMAVCYEIKKTNGYTQSYFSKAGFSLVPGQHHTVNIPLEKWENN
jgi:hypothetical protein